MHAVFEISAVSPSQFPAPDRKEFAFVGRSNVGKSSLLNLLTGLKGLAKVSATPGKTRQINFFRIGDTLRFVDLPGYGYAKASHTSRAEWGKLITNYFGEQRPLGLVLQLIDSRLPLQASDASVLGLFIERVLPVQIVLTKVDKLNQSERSKQTRLLLNAMREIGYTGDLLLVSSLKGLGKKELLQRIFDSAGNVD
ncbi:MAG: ribosome biogenesis GTP-binding protein YihA/YsxC [Bacteroidia bacterium]|nr:ribosome biogenesis GTP-binding protein YihA/YsxC [Bacteroidia bacterium]